MDQVQPQAPSVDEDQFKAKYAPTTNEDSFKDKYRPNPDSSLVSAQDGYIQSGPFSGDLADHMYSQSTGAGKILSAIGQGAKEGWGSNPGMLSQELKYEAERKDADKGIVSGVHDAVMRPLSAFLDTPFRALNAVGGAVSSGLAQVGGSLLETAHTLAQPDANKPASVAGQVIGAPFGAAGELAYEASTGALPEGLHGGVPEVAQKSVDNVQAFQEARARGQVGEGEAGYFNAVPPSADSVEARRAAGEQAGVPAEILPEDAAIPTIHDLARQIDPETFQKVDALQDLQENLHSSIQQEVTNARIALEQGIPENHPESVERRNTIIDLGQRAQEANEKLRDLIPEVADARRRTEELLNSEGKEGDAFRDLVQSQAFEKALAIENIRPKVQEAYQRASDLQVIPETEAEAGTSTKANLKSQKTPAQVEGDEALKDAPRPLAQPEKIPPQQGQGLGAGKGPGEGPGNGGLREVQGTGAERELSVSQRLRAEAIQKGFDAEHSEATFYNPITHADQGEKAVDFLDKNPKEAMDVAMGNTQAPEGVHPEAILQAVKGKADNEGDFQTIHDLAQSSLAREAKTMGQRLGLLRNMYEKIDPVEIMRDIQESRKASAGKAMARTMDEIKKKIDEHMNGTDLDLDSFLKDIECR